MIADIKISILVINIEMVQSVQLTAYNLEIFLAYIHNNKKKKSSEIENILMATVVVAFA